eukprot:830726-Alexandrium_andersonii.AAC.1
MAKTDASDTTDSRSVLGALQGCGHAGHECPSLDRRGGPGDEAIWCLQQGSELRGHLHRVAEEAHAPGQGGEAFNLAGFQTAT